LSGIAIDTRAVSAAPANPSTDAPAANTSMRCGGV
jgi:hypothetical protein